jgi:hypothetical protein
VRDEGKASDLAVWHALRRRLMLWLGSMIKDDEIVLGLPWGLHGAAAAPLFQLSLDLRDLSVKQGDRSALGSHGVPATPGKIHRA